MIMTASFRERVRSSRWLGMAPGAARGPGVRSGLTRKVALLVGLPFGGALVSLAVFWIQMSSSSGSELYVSAVGRQRMLSERLVATASMVAGGQDEDRGELTSLITQYGERAARLRDGGHVDGMVVPPAPRETLPEMDAALRFWERLAPSYRALASLPRTDPAFDRAARSINDAGRGLTEGWDRYLRRWLAWSDSRRWGLFAILAGTALADLVLVAVAYGLTRRFIARPIRLLLEPCRAIASGQWDVRVPVAGTDEIAELGDAFNRMAAELALARRRLEGEHRERERMEAELRLAQKLEAVGQLAAGIAHEINTPMQYIGDSVHFLRRAFDDLLAAFTTARACVSALATSGANGDLASAAREAEETADIGYLQEKVPRAFERTLEGVERVRSIVRAMREFAHPDQKEKAPADLNRALQSALIVSRNEYKYVADVQTDLGELPPVECRLGELNQVFLNLIINAAHAIGETVRGTERKGTISVRSRSDGRLVRISIEDDGCGIPESVRDKIFDPFFTTKPVGKGTGQGLAIARSIVVDKHGGRLTFESEIGRGTRFDVELPTREAETREGSA